MPPLESNNTPIPSGPRQIPIVCPGHTRPLAELQFCRVEDDRTLLVSACHDKMPMLRDGVTGDWIGTFAGHKGAVWSCRLDPSGGLAATASGDFSVRLWDAITGASLCEWKHKHILKSCDFSPNAQRLATGGHEGLLRIYNLSSAVGGKKNNNNKEAPKEYTNTTADNGKALISKVLWVSDTQVVAGCGDGKLRLWNVDGDATTTSPQVTVDTKANAEIRDLELVDDILTVAAGSSVYFYKLPDWTLLKAHKMPIHFKDEGGASLHPVTKDRFVAGGSDLWVRVFNFETGQELECHKGHHGPIRCLRYCPKGDLYASGSEDGTIRLWQTHPNNE